MHKSHQIRDILGNVILKGSVAVHQYFNYDDQQIAATLLHGFQLLLALLETVQLSELLQKTARVVDNQHVEKQFIQFSFEFQSHSLNYVRYHP